jgi:hypothetical protein
LNFHGKSLLNLCISSGLRILNGRYLGDSLGYHTCFTPNGCSTVNYGIVSKCLLSSVKYFCTLDLSYLSDHVQIYFTLKCNINPSFKLRKDTALKKYITYKWTKESKEKLTNFLCSNTTLNKTESFINPTTVKLV